jgi:integrase
MPIYSGPRGVTHGNDSRVVTAGIPKARIRRGSPEILSGTEVERLLAAAGSPKYRAIFMLAYGAGLRVGEITALQAGAARRYRLPEFMGESG